MGKKIRVRRKSPTAAFSGSLIQQNFGESLEKGYVMWDTDTCEHERKFIMNDYGFSKVDITRGEDIEERIKFMKFSNNKKKTKVYITWEDYEENYSVEKENHIKRLVKDKHGCESVRVEFKEIKRDIADIGEDSEDQLQSFEELFKDYIKEGDFNIDDDLMKELIEFSNEVDAALEIDEGAVNVVDDWDLNSVEVCNILSFDKTPIKIDLDAIGGLTGIFGKNFNGKSNVIKAIVWGLYNEIIGGGQGDSKYLVNIYTDSNTGYAKLYLTINGEKYRINRQITTKNGKNTFRVKYEKLESEYDDSGAVVGEIWVDKVSDRKTAEQKEVQNLILDTIGSFDDFTKTSLQAQGGSGDYLSQQQQPKNNLISRFLGLETFKERHDYAKEFFNEVKRNQKNLGNAIDIENKLKDIETEILEKKEQLKSIEEEKIISETKQNDVNDEILELTKKLERVEESGISSKEAAVSKVTQLEDALVNTLKPRVSELEEWLSVNFKKELPFKDGESVSALQSNLSVETSNLNKLKSDLKIFNDWISVNPRKDLIDTQDFPAQIDALKTSLSSLENKLPTFQGKCCPTCGHVEHTADPYKEDACLEDIKINKELIQHKEEKMIESNNVVLHNKKIEDSKERIILLEQTISVKEETIKNIESKIDVINNSKFIIDHNNAVDKNASELKDKKSTIEHNEKIISELKASIEKFEANESKVKLNAEIQSKIDDKTDLYKTYKLAVFNLDKNINNSFGELRVLENNRDGFDEKLNSIKNEERLFKKYSTYLQSVHRDGIPASIIRRKLPIINSKINSILSEVVDFTIELDILMNGDIVETFSFSEDKSDALPLSSASGSQKFIASVVITEALRHMSKLTKPSIRIIDEGFGTLDDELTMGVVNILSYLRSKYKNVFIITHRNEIKDFADNIIEVSKTTEGIKREILDNNPKAGVSQLTIT